MLSHLSRAAVLACVISAPVCAQDPGTLHLRHGSFDPTQSVPAVPTHLQSTSGQQLWLVQFADVPTAADRNLIAENGGQVIKYMPSNAYVVRMDATTVGRLAKSDLTRWVGSYHPAYRIDPALLDDERFAAASATRYNVIVADKKTDKPVLSEKVRDLGGTVVNDHSGSVLFTVDLTGSQLLQFLGFDEVLWVDLWSPEELDVDNARIQGGANYVESIQGYSGQGINAHIYEGIEISHPGFSGPVTVVRSSSASSTHGTNTAGIVFGSGSGNPQYRGLAPDAGKFFTNNGSVNTSRWQVFSDLVNIHDVSHTTASWGNGRTRSYTSISAESDDIVFDHDLAWTQSQSNAGNQDSRPQAWAKNVFSIGGVFHRGNSNPADDSWGGGASIGPASDGRIKPTLTAYYDGIGTTTSNGGYTNGFGGTSGATPIVAGHNVLAIEMYTDEVSPGFGPFGNQLRVPGGTTHQNRPSVPTLKALMCANAAQYSFNGSSTNNRREHQGWGFPDLRRMWDRRNETFIVDEADVLTQGQTRSWPIAVAPNTPDLKIVLNWREPSANPSATFHLINNLSLRVTSPSGTVYWGNNGLQSGVWSVAGGSEDNLNSIESVFVQNPESGSWNVEVLATSIVEDNHLETPAIDADYGLVVTGGTGTNVTFATFGTFGQGCPGSVTQPVVCPELNANGGSLSLDRRDNEYCYLIPNTGSLSINSFDIWSASTGGTVTVPAHIYLPSGGGPASTPIASTTVSVSAAQGFYTATFANPVSVSGDFYIGFDTSAQTSYISSLTTGTGGTGYYRDQVNGPSAWTLSGLVQRPAWRINCSAQPIPLTPSLGNVGVPRLGSSYDVTLADAVANANAALITGVSNTMMNGVPLPIALPLAPGCNVLVSVDSSDSLLVSASGTGSRSFVVPNSASLVGAELFHQFAVLDAVNPLGVVVSDAGRALIGN